ncbi:MAG: methyltransferase domain-containing protein [candidate division Zixibacteria bacterium]|nr:methyltransferase domain-containing protein [candidate division Zixibacteria bacterium]
MTTTPDIVCYACEGRTLEHVCDMPLYIENGDIQDTVVKCTSCGTYMRLANYADDTVRTHFNVASYTSEKQEENFRHARVGFFEHLIDLALSHLGRPAQDATVLDIGPAYGHYVELFATRGASVTVVELVDRLRNRLADRGFPAYAHIDDIPADQTFDIVSAIDSFYYFQEPAPMLGQMRQRVAPGGLLIMRVTNRPPTFNLMRLLGQSISTDRFGDAKFNYSYAGITRLLERTGFAIERTYLREPGKNHPSKVTAMYYQASLLASMLTGRKLSPGLTLIARPTDSQ